MENLEISENRLPCGGSSGTLRRMETKPSFKSPIGHFWLDSWILASVIELATRRFCLRFLTPRIDPCGRLFDQMCMAARSSAANIAEGHARRSTSRETQMRLYDVARGSLAELAGDFRSWLMLTGEAPWSDNDPDARAVFSTPLDRPTFDHDLERNVALHVLAQTRKFDRWLAGEDSLAAARTILVLVARGQMTLSRQMERAHADFVETGGFAENLTKDRLAARDAAHAAAGTAPPCPKCGKPMRERIAQRGVRAGKRFWSCTGYPECTGTRPLD